MLGANIGIDLGTKTVAVYVEGKGVVLNEPSVVAYGPDGRIKAVGTKAGSMPGRNPDNFRIVKPIEHGVVSDFTATKHMVQYFMAKICKNMIFKPNIVACVPSMVTQLERKTILELIMESGAASATIVEEPLAAAFGAGVNKEKTSGVMVVDIGGGTTDVAVITMGNVSLSFSTRIAGNALDEAIKRQLKNERDLIVSNETAEELKIKIGSALYRDVELAMTVKGKNYITGQPVTAEITSGEVFLAMRPKLLDITEAIRSVLEQTPPELSADIFDNGIILTGGGSELRSMAAFVENKIGVKTVVAEDPLNCVALGTGKVIEYSN